LLATKSVEDEVPNGGDMAGRGVGDRLAARVGDLNVSAATVVDAFIAGDEFPALHPAEVVREAALFPIEGSLEFVRTQPPIGRLGELHQHVIVR